VKKPRRSETSVFPAQGYSALPADAAIVKIDGAGSSVLLAALVPERELFAPTAAIVAQLFPIGYIFLNFRPLQYDLLICEDIHMDDESTIGRRALAAALAFGSMIRKRRKSLNLRQDQLALATGVGRRFLIELEAGKPSCQLGRSLLVADALGLTPADIPISGGPQQSASAGDLPELPDEAVEEPDGQPTRIL
jgi:transcriptional regulator with XRE-family HTH domain